MDLDDIELKATREFNGSEPLYKIIDRDTKIIICLVYGYEYTKKVLHKIEENDKKIKIYLKDFYKIEKVEQQEQDELFKKGWKVLSEEV